MADRFAGEIHIGGALRVADHDPDEVARFLGECSEQPIAWGEPSPGREVTLSTIDQVVDEAAGFIIFRDDQARYGEFEELEELCRQLGLPYDRISEARYEHNGELVRWRPGMEEPLVETADQSGKPVILREQLEACLATLKAGRVQEGIKALQDLAPDIAPLPRFEVDAGK